MGEAVKAPPLFYIKESYMKWVKPNGTEIETRDTEEIVAYCKSLGWKEKKTARRGRPRKEAVKSSDDSPAADD